MPGGGVNYKVGADVGNFKQGMAEAQASLRTLDAALKNNEASFKAGGDAQVYMEQKTKLLTDKMKQQRELAAKLQEQLKKMRESGVKPTSTEYQNLQAKLLNAQTAMNETKVALDNLDVGQQKAATSAGNLADSVNSIGKKISLEQVISGIGSITSAMETAAGKAVNLGEAIWDNVMNSAKWADDTATQAMMLGITVDELQRAQKVAATVGETSVTDWFKARLKLEKSMVSDSADIMGIFERYGVKTSEMVAGKYGNVVTQFRDADDVMWELLEAMKNYDDIVQRDTDASAIFGRNFQAMWPMANLGREGYEEAMKDQKVVTDESVDSLGKVNDAYVALLGNIETLKTEVLAGFAPGMLQGLETADDLIRRLINFAQSDKGQEMLKNMGDTVSALFEDLGRIDPETVVEGFTKVLEKLVGGFEWVRDNKDSIVEALKYIVAGWAGLKITGGALTVLELVSGLKGLTGQGTPSGNGGGQAATVAGGGTSWLGRMISGASAKIAATNVSNVGLWGAILQDYFYNNTYTGQVARNTGSLLEGVRQGTAHFGESVRANAASFAGDWAGVAQEAYRTSWWDDIFEYYAKQAETLKKNMELSAEELQKWGLIAPSASESSILGKPGDLMESFNQWFGNSGEKVQIPTEPEVPENAAEDIASQIGTVTVPIRLGTRDIWAALTGGAGAGGSHGQMIQMHANGIWSVPFDNYPALLHRGERVVPAREVGSRSFNSNVYVEKMVMNNGTDAQGLANAMAAANRRRMSGYGS